VTGHFELQGCRSKPANRISLFGLPIREREMYLVDECNNSLSTFAGEESGREMPGR
jgi:hypothetical protein